MLKRTVAFSLLGLACASCAVDDKVAVATRPPLAQTVSEAIQDAKAGKTDKALQSLRDASAAQPADKLPLLYTAQIYFDKSRYSEAIASARQALQRDPYDQLANSIVAVSGLRLASAALNALSQKNAVPGNVRAEAQDLAKMLRTSLGEDMLVPPAGAPRPPKAPARKPVAGKPAGGADPFGALK